MPVSSVPWKDFDACQYVQFHREGYTHCLVHEGHQLIEGKFALGVKLPVTHTVTLIRFLYV